MSVDIIYKTFFNDDGYEVSVIDNASSSGNAGLLIAGSDGSDSHYISLDGSGNQLIVGPGTAGSPEGGVASIQGVNLAQELNLSGQIDVGSILSNTEITQLNQDNLLSNVGGLGAAGSANVGNPISLGGSDGSNTTNILSDPNGRLIFIGASNNSTSISGAPVRMAASDGSLVKDILADTSGRLIIVGTTDNGSAPSGNPVLMGGSNGSLTINFKTDSLGRLESVGAVASSLGIGGNPLRLGGSDGSLTTDLLTDSSGYLIFSSPNVRLSAPTSNPGLGAGWDDTNVQMLKTDQDGALAVNEKKSNYALVSSFAATMSSTVLLNANADREGALIYNNSDSYVYVKLGSSASTSSFSFIVKPLAYIEVPADYTGEISAIWAESSSGTIKVTEITTIDNSTGIITVTINGITSEYATNEVTLIGAPETIQATDDGSYSLYEDPSTLISSGSVSGGSPINIVPGLVSSTGNYHIVISDTDPATQDCTIYFSL